MSENITSPATISNIKAALDNLKGSDRSINRYLELRHMLTENITRNLYNDAARDEGREALKIRDALDKTISEIKQQDLESGSMEAIAAFKKGIAIENIAEQFAFIEQIVKSAKGKSQSIKFEMRKLADDPDRFQRFSTIHQQMIRSAAEFTLFEKFLFLISLSFINDLIARGKTETILRSLQAEVEALK